MNKEDLKAIFLIILMLGLIAILIILGVSIYSRFTGNDENILEVFEEGYTAILNKNENQKPSSVIIEENSQLDQVESANKQTQSESDQSNTEKTDDNYFYNQLNSYSKMIYDELEKNKENMKSGTYKIDFGDSFSELLKRENGEDLLKDYYQSAIETYLYDNPEVFYLEPTKMYINIRTIKKVFTTTYEVYIDSGKEANYLSEECNTKQQVLAYENRIEEEANKILSQIEKGTEYQKILMIHDYLVNNVSFEESLSKNNIYNMYGALVNKEAVCEGYAKAFKYLMDKIEVECVVVIGMATNSKGETQNHAWNYMNLDNKWYAIDVTWDDPIVIGHGYVGNDIKYRYFLKGSTTIDKDHFKETQFTEGGQEYNYPQLSLNDY
ncbi:MAG: hypothetical protein IJ312_06150 [Treponema sp.]|nr:hypothetical protein [Treponema sp.]